MEREYWRLVSAYRTDIYPDLYIAKSVCRRRRFPFRNCITKVCALGAKRGFKLRGGWGPRNIEQQRGRYRGGPPFPRPA